jgi:hypothetical protein
MRRLSGSVLFSLALGAVAAMGLAGTAAAQQYPANGPTIAVVGVSGNTVNVSGSGWQAGAQITVTIQSAPVVLGTVTANAAGTFSQNFVIPCSIGNGAHTVSASGIAADGTSRTASTQITLSNCTVSASTGKLAFTGSNSTFPFAAAGVALVLVGSVLTVSMRRRRTAHTLKV